MLPARRLASMMKWPIRRNLGQCVCVCVGVGKGELAEYRTGLESESKVVGMASRNAIPPPL